MSFFKIFCLFGGILTSQTPIESAALVASAKPRDLQVIQETTVASKPDFLVALHDQLAHFLLRQAIVLESEFFRHNRIEHDAARRCFNDAAIIGAQLNQLMDTQPAAVIVDLLFFAVTGSFIPVIAAAAAGPSTLLQHRGRLCVFLPCSSGKYIGSHIK